MEQEKQLNNNFNILFLDVQCLNNKTNQMESYLHGKILCLCFSVDEWELSGVITLLFIITEEMFLVASFKREHQIYRVVTQFLASLINFRTLPHICDLSVEIIVRCLVLWYDQWIFLLLQYIDVLMVTWPQEKEDNLNKVLLKICIQANNCLFGNNAKEALEINISCKGIGADQAKVETIINFQPLTLKK